jgi:hypothetical protein
MGWGALGQEANGQVSRRRVLLPSPSGGEVSRIETGVFLGVMSLRVPEEVTAQLGLTEGFGLMVEEVLPGSPAEKAGLKRHDVLLTFGDQELVNPEQLLALVRRGKKGESVGLTVMSHGVRKEVQVELEEGPVEIVAKSRGVVPAEILAGDGEPDAAVEDPSAKRLIRRDDSGEYALNIEKGVMTFSAVPKEGEGGSWPVDTDEQKQVVPARFQEKLRGLSEWLKRVPGEGTEVSG